MILRNSSISGIRKLIALFTLSRCFDVLTTNTCLKNRNTKHLETLKIMEILNLVETTSLFHLCRNNSVSSSPEETFAIVQQVQKALRKQSKIRIYCSTVRAALLYGFETSVLDHIPLGTFDRRMSEKYPWISFPVLIRYKTMLQLFKILSISNVFKVDVGSGWAKNETFCNEVKICRK